MMLDELSLFSPTVIAEVAQLNAIARPAPPPSPKPKPKPFEFDYESVLLNMHNGDREALATCSSCQWFLQYQREKQQP